MRTCSSLPEVTSHLPSLLKALRETLLCAAFGTNLSASYYNP
jgi:hypothetical protein